MEKIVRKVACPYCGSEQIKIGLNEYEHFYCERCSMAFNGAEIERENIRHRMSALLMDTSEDDRLKVDIHINNYEQIVEAWQSHNEGIFFSLHNKMKADEPDEKDTYDFDELEVDELIYILACLWNYIEEQ